MHQVSAQRHCCEFDIDFCLYTVYIYNPSFEHPIILADSPGCPSYWLEGNNAILVKSQSDNYGGVVAADGNQMLVLFGSIMQPVLFTPGLTYLLTISAATCVIAPGCYYGIDDRYSLVVSVGSARLVVDQPIRYTTMATYSLRFVANNFSQYITIQGYSVLLDSLSVQRGNSIT